MLSRFSVSKLRSAPPSPAASLDASVTMGREHEPRKDHPSVAQLFAPLSLPRHLAIIMDGNGRWAKARGKSRLEGHKAGANVAEKILDCVLKKGIPYLTLFAFSSENWRRSNEEVQGLMRLLEQYLVRNRQSFLKDRRVRLSVFGDKTGLPASLVAKLDDLERLSQTYAPTASKNGKGEDTERVGKNGTREHGTGGNGAEGNGTGFLHLGLALNYGGRDDIVRATRRLVARCLEGGERAEDLTEQHLSATLDTASFPDPDLLIRTGGEQRISNFLLWQCAYSELMFTDCPWPDFDEAHLESMLEAFGRRERRFGASESQPSKRA